MDDKEREKYEKLTREKEKYELVSKQYDDLYEKLEAKYESIEFYLRDLEEHCKNFIDTRMNDGDYGTPIDKYNAFYYKMLGRINSKKAEYISLRQQIKGELNKVKNAKNKYTNLANDCEERRQACYSN